MKATKRFVSALLMSVVCFSCLTACSTKQDGDDESTEPIVLKFATEMASGTPEVEAAEMFASNVYEKTNGEVEIQIYADGQLGEPATLIESAQLGNVDIFALPASDFKSFDNIFGVEAIPYLYANNEAVLNVMKDSGVFDQQKQVLADNGMVLLNESREYFRGPYRVLVSKTPVRTIDDLEGLRFRTFENKNYMTAYEILGANPIVIAWSETYMALQNGIADACTSAIGSLKAQKLTEIAPYVTNVNEYVSTILIVAGSPTYEALSERNKMILKECADQLGHDVETLVDGQLADDIAEMEDNGVEFIDIDTAPARELLKDFYYSLEKDGVLPEGVVDVVLAQ